MPTKGGALQTTFPRIPRGWFSSSRCRGDRSEAEAATHSPGGIRCMQGRLYNVQSPVQNKNAGPLVQKVGKHAINVLKHRAFPSFLCLLSTCHDIFSFVI